jgi:aconitate hydratase
MAATSRNSFGARAELATGDGRSFGIYRLDALAPRFDVGRLPFCLKVLLENLLRHEDDVTVGGGDIEALAGWDPAAEPDREIAFAPARILMQDFTGVPAVVDLAVMRDAMVAMSGDPSRVNPQVPAELVIDHSIVADVYGVPDAFVRNAALEFERNRERYQFLRWGQNAFANFRVVPPNTGICHQVNLEYLARVVFVDEEREAYPDTLLGTDSHTTMVNGLGVLGWGVGGIEAEAAMLGQPVSMLIPRVVGFRLTGALPEGATATDLVLTVTEVLRRHGVVGKFVEFCGEGVARVPLENRATIGNMSPEYGSTCAIFPVDQQTLRYLELTGRPAGQVGLVEAYAKEQGLWHNPAEEPAYSELVELDLSTVRPSLAGPARPQDRVPLERSKQLFRASLSAAVPEAAKAADAARRAAGAGYVNDGGSGPDDDVLPDGVRNGTADEAVMESFPASDPPAYGSARSPAAGQAAGRDAPGGPPAAHPDPAAHGDRYRQVAPVALPDGTGFELDHGHVVIAAITSCTNTSNPSVMVAAGLLAKKAVERGLTSKPWVKTSLAPGSKVVVDYFERAGLTPYLEKLGFHVVGYGCTTCIGNSGPLLPEISDAVNGADLAVAAVLSGNRNFEGRINQDVRLNYLASPPLVVAYALAGTMDIDVYAEPLGTGAGGRPVYLRDVWPSSDEVASVVSGAIASDMFQKSYAEVFKGDDNWNGLQVPTGERFRWDDSSTYVRRPPYFEDMPEQPAAVADIHGARVLAWLGDSVTTDHISPAGTIRRDSPAGRWLMEHHVDATDFNSYGSRRGNHEVMIRGTFANIRLRNRLAPGTEGGVTRHLPGGEQLSIYDAAERYRKEGVPLLVLAGKEYGSGSSRDWAAKGTVLLGVRAVLAQSFERIHRSNLVGMGVLPLQFGEGESAESHGLTGEETFDILGLDGLAEGAPLPGELVVDAGGKRFPVRLRIDTPKEEEYYRHGGILQYVLRQLKGRG